MNFCLICGSEFPREWDVIDIDSGSHNEDLISRSWTLLNGCNKSYPDKQAAPLNVYGFGLSSPRSTLNGLYSYLKMSDPGIIISDVVIFNK